MASCPAGHDSATTDYCDTCGLAIDSATASLPAVAPTAPPAGPRADTCAACGEPRFGRFCEACGHDDALPPPPQFSTGPDRPGTAHPSSAPVRERPAGSGPQRRAAEQPPAPARREPAQPTGSWTAVVRADRGWFDEVRSRRGPDAGAVEFPRFCPERRFTLAGSQVAIGRRSRSRGTDPEIDLSGPPLDPGVSAQHALLLARPDGGWDVVDLDSTNGTTVGEGGDPIAAFTPVPLVDGDRIRLGAWTTITVERG